MVHDFPRLAEETRQRLLPALAPGSFAPQHNWDHLGQLVESMEARGCYLMTNSAATPNLRRMASFHRSTARGFPCVGTSEWGSFATHGEAVLLAAHAALFEPRA